MTEDRRRITDDRNRSPVMCCLSSNTPMWPNLPTHFGLGCWNKTTSPLIGPSVGVTECPKFRSVLAFSALVHPSTAYAGLPERRMLAGNTRRTLPRPGVYRLGLYQEHSPLEAGSGVFRFSQVPAIPL